MHSSHTIAAIDYALSHQADGTVILQLIGELDMAGVAAVETALWQATREPPPLLVLDLRAVTFLDSAGVLLLFHAYQRQKAADKPLRIVVNPEQSVNRVLTISGLRKLPGIGWDTVTAS